MVEFGAAFLGAIVGGILALVGGVLLQVLDRGRMKRSLQAAISTEIRCLLELVRQRRYAQSFRAIAEVARTQLPGDIPPKFEANVGDGHFSVFEENAANIGCLDVKHVVRIIAFYEYARSWTNSIKFVVERGLKPGEQEAAAAYYEMLADLAIRLDTLGTSLADDIAPTAAKKLIEETVRALDVENSPS